MDFNLKILLKNYLKNYIIYLIIFLALTLIGIYSISKINNKYKYEIGLMVGNNSISNYVYKITKLVKTDLILNDIKNKLKLNYSLQEIKDNIIVSYNNKSDYINIIISFSDKEILSDISSELLNSLKKQSKLLYDFDNIHIVNQKEIKLSNNKNLYKIFVFILSLLISFVVSVIVYLYKQINKFNDNVSNYKAPVIRKIE